MQKVSRLTSSKSCQSLSFSIYLHAWVNTVKPCQATVSLSNPRHIFAENLEPPVLTCGSSKRNAQTQEENSPTAGHEFAMYWAVLGNGNITSSFAKNNAAWKHVKHRDTAKRQAPTSKNQATELASMSAG